MSYNLEIVQGTDYTRTFTVLNINNTPLPLSMYTLYAQIRRNNTSDEYVSFVMTVTDAAHGKVQMFLPHTITSRLNGKYSYDIFLQDSNLKRQRIESGIITILPNITRIP